MLILCIAMKYGASFSEVAIFTNFLGIAASILYLLAIPESPKWLFLKKGADCQEAIANLNYIAWFNGSNMVVPEDAVLDIAN